MTLDITKNVYQSGKHFSVVGEASTNSTADDTGVLLDFSADITASPFSGDAVYSATKIARIILVPSVASTSARYELMFDATTNVIFAGASVDTVDLDLTNTMQAGVVDPKDAGTTGDIVINRDVTAGGDVADHIFFIVEGELIT